VTALDLLARFVFIYPALMAVVWIVGGLVFWWKAERGTGLAPGAHGPDPDAWPPVTVVVPCRNEAAAIARTCRNLCRLDYPDYRVLLVDDASTDGTAEAVRPFLDEYGFFHLLRLTHNHGKAGALNAALELVPTPLMLVVDADTVLDERSLHRFVRPFLRQPRLGAVTGNPLPQNRAGLLGNLQAAEFAAIIGLIKRSQRIWGRLLTVSGCAAMYRTETLRRVGGFSTRTATDDIDITWRIQRDASEVWFEPRATVLIQIPLRVGEYLRQRYRWALGGWHLLRTHASVWWSWRHRRLWPTYLEFAVSYLWAFCFVGFTVAWAAALLLGRPLPGLSPVPAWHGGVLSLLCVVQMATAVFVNRTYDPGLGASFFWVPWYPLFFFAVGAFLAVSSAPRGLFGPLEGIGRWKSPGRTPGDQRAPRLRQLLRRGPSNRGSPLAPRQPLGTT